MIQNQLFRQSMFAGLLLLAAIAIDTIIWSSIVMAQE